MIVDDIMHDIVKKRGGRFLKALTGMSQQPIIVDDDDNYEEGWEALTAEEARFGIVHLFTKLSETATGTGTAVATATALATTVTTATGATATADGSVEGTNHSPGVATTAIARTQQQPPVREQCAVSPRPTTTTHATATAAAEGSFVLGTRKRGRETSVCVRGKKQRTHH